MSAWRVARKVLLILPAGVVLVVAVALWAYRDIPAAELEARYAGSGTGSQFITIDGVRMHFRDEGSCPAVVLLPANFSNLIDWDPWVDALRDRYRVVRFDMTSHGLTGTDPTI